MRRFVLSWFVIIAFSCAFPVHLVLAAMSSSSFLIPSETVNDTGGESTSASFIVNDSIGEIGAQQGAGSASFLMNSGFQSMTPEPVFTFTISSGTLALSPAPSVSVISTASTILTTSTNAPFGYSTTVVDDGQFRSLTDAIIDVADGAVGPVGTEEYGIGLTGADRAFADDRATVALPRVTPGVPRVIASSPTFGANRATTVTFKFTMASSTTNGTYGHVVTFVSTPNY